MARQARRHRRTFGAVRKLPSGRYQARYLGPDGVQRTAPETFPSRDAADGWLATVRADVLRGKWTAPDLGDVPLADYLAGWLSTRANLAPRTAELYARLSARWITARLGGARGVQLGAVPVGAITPALVRQWHALVVAEAHAAVLARVTSDAASRHADKRRHPARVWALASGLQVAPTGRLAPAVLAAWEAAGRPHLTPPRPVVQVPPTAGRTQAAQAYRLLRTVLGTAVAEGLLDANPCRVEGATVVRRPERRPATVEDVGRLAELVAPRYRAAVLVAAWSGLRGGELFALARRHVDLTAGTVRVERALLELSNQPASFGPPKSDAGRRTVHLPRFLLDELRAHLDAFTGPDADALVFTTTTGRPVGRGSRTHVLAAARKAIGRPDLRWHDLRHTGAVLAASTGASLVELQRRLGHGSVRAALLYQHAADDRDQLLASRLDELAAAGQPTRLAHTHATPRPVLTVAAVTPDVTQRHPA